MPVFKNIIFCFIYLLLLHICNYAQVPTTFKFENITRETGLPKEAIHNMLQDHRGFLWLGTNDGLIRYDGYKFKMWNANPKDKNSFESNQVNLIKESDNHELHFLSNYKLWAINTITLKIKRKTILQSDEKIYNISELAQKEKMIVCDSILIWTDSAFNVKQQFRNFNLKVIKTNNIALKYPYILLEDFNNNKIVFNYLKNESFLITINNNPANQYGDFVGALYDSANSRILGKQWSSGIYSFPLYYDKNYSTNPKLEPIFGNGSQRVFLYNNSNYISASEYKLLITDTKNKLELGQKHLHKDSILPMPYLNALISNDNQLWVGTLHGITKFDFSKSLINSIVVNKSKNVLDPIDEIIKGNDGCIYLLNINKGLCRVEKNNTITQISKKKNYSWSLIKDENLIYATGAGDDRFMVYNTLTKTLKHPEFLKPYYGSSDLTLLAFKAKNGDMWYSNNAGEGLVRQITNTQVFTHYKLAQNPRPFTHRHLESAAEDINGDIWFCYIRNANILRWSAKEQKFFEHNTKALVPELPIEAGIKKLFIDSKQNLWMGSGATLMYYNILSKKSRLFSNYDGIPTTTVGHFAEDKNGRIWITTAEGLCCFLPELEKFITFTKKNDLPEENLSNGPLYFDNSENKLFVGGNYTLAWFNPDSLVASIENHYPKIYFDEMYVNGKKYDTDLFSSIQLKPNENNIQFTFSAPDFKQSNQIEFQYQLKGVSNDWIDIGAERSINFLNLYSGKYTISIRCRYKGANIWKEVDKPFTFTINQIWYKKWWFIALFALSLFGIVYYLMRLFYKQKLAKEKAIEQERTRIATDMHDDFGANLSRIKFLSEKIKLQKPEKDMLNNDLNKISVYSDEMAEKMNEIVWALNQRYDSIGDLIAFTRSYASEYLSQHNIKLVFESNYKNDNNIAGEVRRNIFLVIKESLQNIIKHAAASEVSITIHENNKLNIIIKDNGIGINLNNIRQFANGISNMKKRISSIGGKIEFINNNGTEIRIEV
jgi:signal transduction histidine kinase/ligand-binding sensor domain-containing protein